LLPAMVGCLPARRRATPESAAGFQAIRQALSLEAGTWITHLGKHCPQANSYSTVCSARNVWPVLQRLDNPQWLWYPVARPEMTFSLVEWRILHADQVSGRALSKSAANSRRQSGCPPPFSRGQAFRGHDKALLGVVTPAKAGVHVLHTQLKDFDGTLPALRRRLDRR
jgi:hypothetical protein